MDDLLQEFIAETSDSMAALDNDLVDLEARPGDAELIGRIFRLVHTVKGNCGIFGPTPARKRRAPCGKRSGAIPQRRA